MCLPGVNSIISTGYGPTEEGTLKSAILNGYDRTLRPYSPTELQIDMFPISLNALVGILRVCVSVWTYIHTHIYGHTKSQSIHNR